MNRCTCGDVISSGGTGSATCRKTGCPNRATLRINVRSFLDEKNRPSKAQIGHLKKRYFTTAPKMARATGMYSISIVISQVVRSAG